MINKQKEDWVDRFAEIVKGLEIDKNIANKLANFIHYEIETAKQNSLHQKEKRLCPEKVAKVITDLVIQEMPIEIHMDIWVKLIERLANAICSQEDKLRED